MDRQLTELRRYIDAYTLAKNEREGERKGGRGARIWELNETLRHRRNRRGAKLFSPLAGRERRGVVGKYLDRSERERWKDTRSACQKERTKEGKRSESSTM